MSRFSIAITVLFLLSSCHEVFEPEVEEIEPYLVVEGYISTRPGKHYIYLKNSKSYNDRPYDKGVKGALVYVSLAKGGNIYFEDSGNGVYVADLTEKKVAKIGETYTLKIFTTNGDEYSSTPQTVVECADIESITCDYDWQSLLTENASGDALEEDIEGINIEVETKGILPSDNYYLYKYNGYEQHQTVLTQGINFIYMFRHRRLSFKYLNSIHTVNADEYGDFKVSNETIVFISEEDMTKYSPIYDEDSFVFQNTRFEGLLMKVDQYSVSSDVYVFYNSIENQLSADGSLFAPSIPSLRGNMRCENDSTKEIAGVFAAVDIDTYHAYLYLRYGKTYSQEIDSIPELWLDTCAYRMPDSWIKPPF